MRIIYSTCVTVFFLNSPTIKVTEGSCCSLHEASWTWWQRSKFFASHLLWACRQGLPQLPRNATQQGQRSQQPKSSHSQIFCKAEIFCRSANVQRILLQLCIHCIYRFQLPWNWFGGSSTKASQSAFTRIPAFFISFSESFSTILHFSFFHHYSSFRLLPSPPLLDGKGVPQKPPHHVDAHPRAAHVGSAVAHLSRKFVN